MKKLFLVFLLVGSFVSFAGVAQAQPQAESRSITLAQILEACPGIAQSCPSFFVKKALLGQVVVLDDQLYELRCFFFEDPSSVLKSSATFAQYVNFCDLDSMLSTRMTYRPGFDIETFYSRDVNFDDDVEWAIALRCLPQQYYPLLPT